MSQEKRTLVTPAGAITDIVIALGVFAVFCFYIMPTHVFFHHPLANLALSAYGSSVMGGFAWMALSLFRVTRVDQKLRKQAQAQEQANAN